MKFLTLYFSIKIIFCWIFSNTQKRWKKILGSSDAYQIPYNIQHDFGILSDEDLEYIEIFNPPKEWVKMK